MFRYQIAGKRREMGLGPVSIGQRSRTHARPLTGTAGGSSTASIRSSSVRAAGSRPRIEAAKAVTFEAVCVAIHHRHVGKLVDQEHRPMAGIIARLCFPVDWRASGCGDRHHDS